MKKYYAKISYVLVLLVITITGCTHESNVNETIYGSGRIVSQDRIVKECSGLNIQYAGDVNLLQGEEQSIRVEADDNIISNILTYADGDILTVGIDKGSYSNIKVKIYVTLKSINQIAIQGAGNVTVQNSITGNQLVCSINGAGDIYLNGNAEGLTCGINGAGNINAFNFPVKMCNATIKGTGNCSVNVSDNLEAAISGVGNIIYDGNPIKVKSTISGIGKIIRR